MNAKSVLRIGLIGDHIGQSKFSAAMELLCSHHGLDLKFTPIDTAEIADFDFDKTVSRIKRDGWSGVTVTHPYKRNARAWIGSAISAGAAELSSTNILRFEPELRGFNTDYTGFCGAWLASMGKTSPGTVAVAGAGGVAGAIVPALLELGADQVLIWDKIESRAADLAKSSGPSVEAVSLSESPSVVMKADGLVNATALGMGGDGRSAFEASWIANQRWAFDAVYTPTNTPFSTVARAAGLSVISGFELFRHMILASFKAYTGIEPNAAELLPALDVFCPD